MKAFINRIFSREDLGSIAFFSTLLAVLGTWSAAASAAAIPMTIVTWALPPYIKRTCPEDGRECMGKKVSPCRKTFSRGTFEESYSFILEKNNRYAAFSPDWHALNKLWFPHTASKEARKCSDPQWAIWRETSPAVMNERESIMFSLASAWIVLFTEDGGFLKGVMPEIEEIFLYLPCEQLYYVPFFFALNVIPELYFQEETLLS